MTEETIGSRLKQLSSRHEDILENLDRTDKLAAEKRGEPRVDDEESSGEHGPKTESHAPCG